MSAIAIDTSVSSLSPGMRVDEQAVEPQRFDELGEAVVESADVVAFAQDPSDLAGVHARRHEIQAPHRSCRAANRGRTRPAESRSDPTRSR